MMHTWISTQNEGWRRIEFDRLNIPYDYISTQTVSKTSDLRSKYDVIIFAPGVRGNPLSVITGMPMHGNPLPWKNTSLTPNLVGKIDETDDMRPGLGWSGLENLREFVRKGGVLITSNDTATFTVNFGFTTGVTISPAQRLKVTGSALRSKIVDASPILYGYSDNLAIFASNPPVFGVTNIIGGAAGRRAGAEERERPTGRGGADDSDVPQGRVPSLAPEERDPACATSASGSSLCQCKRTPRVGLIGWRRRPRATPRVALFEPCQLFRVSRCPQIRENCAQRELSSNRFRKLDIQWLKGESLSATVQNSICKLNSITVHCS